VEAGNMDMLQWLRSQDPPRSFSFDSHLTEDSTGVKDSPSGELDVWEDYLMDDLPD
jgi:hypothetical protein